MTTTKNRDAQSDIHCFLNSQYKERITRAKPSQNNMESGALKSTQPPQSTQSKNMDEIRVRIELNVL